MYSYLNENTPAGAEDEEVPCFPTNLPPCAGECRSCRGAAGAAACLQ
jgi:hypothetical protein